MFSTSTELNNECSTLLTGLANAVQQFGMQAAKGGRQEPAARRGEFGPRRDGAEVSMHDVFNQHTTLVQILPSFPSRLSFRSPQAPSFATTRTTCYPSRGRPPGRLTVKYTSVLPTLLPLSIVD